MMRIAANPRQAYHQAEYVVFSAPPFTLRIGEPSEALTRLYARLGCEGCIYLTACNPRSRRLRPKANARRMRALSRVLARQGWRTIPGEGRDPGGAWPAEPSLLVPGMDVADGILLARRFGQNALVAAPADGIPRLMWVPWPGRSAQMRPPPQSAKSEGVPLFTEPPCIDT